MNSRYGTNRADDEQGRNRAPPASRRTVEEPTDCDITTEAVDDAAALSADHCREWRRWVIETVTAGTAGVVPVSQLVETVAEREPDDICRSQIRAALIGQILPAVECEPGLEYDSDRAVVVNYGH